MNMWIICKFWKLFLLLQMQWFYFSSCTVWNEVFKTTICVEFFQRRTFRDKWPFEMNANWQVWMKPKIKKFLGFRRSFIAIHAYFIRNSAEIPFCVCVFVTIVTILLLLTRKMLKTSALAWMARLLRDNFYIEIPSVKSVLWFLYETFSVNLSYRQYFNCIRFVQSYFKYVLQEHKLCCIRLDCAALWPLNRKPENKQKEKLNQLLIFM